MISHGFIINIRYSITKSGKLISLCSIKKNNLIKNIKYLITHARVYGIYIIKNNQFLSQINKVFTLNLVHILPI